MGKLKQSSGTTTPTIGQERPIKSENFKHPASTTSSPGSGSPFRQQSARCKNENLYIINVVI